MKIDELRLVADDLYWHRIMLSDGRPAVGLVGGGHENPFSRDEMMAIRERVVACVNAAVSIPTADLVVGESYWTKLVEQREMMLTALSWVSQKLTAAGRCHPNAMPTLLGEAHEAIDDVLLHIVGRTPGNCGKCKTPGLCLDLGRACDDREEEGRPA